jgi:hypothetical protein
MRRMQVLRDLLRAPWIFQSRAGHRPELGWKLLRGNAIQMTEAARLARALAVAAEGARRPR